MDFDKQIIPMSNGRFYLQCKFEQSAIWHLKGAGLWRIVRSLYGRRLYGVTFELVNCQVTWLDDAVHIEGDNKDDIEFAYKLLEDSFNSWR